MEKRQPILKTYMEKKEKPEESFSNQSYRQGQETESGNTSHNFGRLNPTCLGPTARARKKAIETIKEGLGKVAGETVCLAPFRRNPKCEKNPA